MPRPLRTALPEFGIFHVVSRGVDRCAIYRDDVDRRTFLTILGAVVVDWRWTVHAYCLMTTHYHLILEVEQPRMSCGVQYLNGRYAQSFNRRHKRNGHLFGGRFTVFVIDDEDWLEASCRYVLDNPVRAGICQTPEEWPWSKWYSGSDPRLRKTGV